jgi:hypothetical protein
LIQLRAEFFNALDHAQYSDLTTALGAANLGVIPSASVAPRIIRFAAKVSYLDSLCMSGRFERAWLVGQGFSNDIHPRHHTKPINPALAAEGMSDTSQTFSS